MNNNNNTRIMNVFKGSIVTSIICLAFGVIFAIFPLDAIYVIARIIGVILLIVGAGVIIYGFAAKDKLAPKLIGGIIAILFGLWMLLRPDTFAAVIPIIFGLVMIYHGVRNLIFAINHKRAGGQKWLWKLLIAIITAALGVFLIVTPLLALSITTRIIGIFWIYDGVSGIIMNIVNKKKQNGSNPKGPIDVPYEEIK